MSFFFLNATATTEIYTLSLHDALPISRVYRRWRGPLCKRSESGFASARCHLQRRDVQASRTLSRRSQCGLDLRRKRDEFESVASQDGGRETRRRRGRDCTGARVGSKT